MTLNISFSLSLKVGEMKDNKKWRRYVRFAILFIPWTTVYVIGVFSDKISDISYDLSELLEGYIRGD